MSVIPDQQPVEPDTPGFTEPLHHPHKQDHPGRDEPDSTPPSPAEELRTTAG